MELQFHKTGMGCLKNIKWDVQNQEQTQEVKLGEGMPDIGRVLGAWGQVVVRGKQWQSDSLGLSGGVMVWVLYAPEDGSPVRSVEAWVPFQMNWDIPDTQNDGTMVVNCLLRSADARMTSARKMMVRVNVGAQMQGYLPDYVDIYHCDDLPEDVQVLKKTYPVCLPKEAGEKPFTLDEEMELPSSCPKAESFLSYRIQPEILETRVMSGKVVFRGNCLVHAVFAGEDGRLGCWDFDVPFSQFAELNGEFDEAAYANVIPQVTGLEIGSDEQGRVRMKAGITGQYVICQDDTVEVIADAYSPRRDVTAHCQMLDLPAIGNGQTMTIPVDHGFQAEGVQVADVAFYPDQPRVHRTPECLQIQLPAMAQMLYYDREESLQMTSTRWEDEMEMEASPEAQMLITLCPTGKAEASFGPQDALVHADVKLTVAQSDGMQIAMATALELGQLREADPCRPSLILRRMEQGGLWQLGKKCGSSRDAILKANGLEEEPPVGKMLIIPVL